MADMQFDDNHINMQFKSRVLLGQAETPGVVNLLLKKGIVKDENQAHKVLLGIILVSVIVAICVPIIFGVEQNIELKPGADEMMQDSVRRIEAGKYR